jgi:hypothetical protein
LSLLQTLHTSRNNLIPSFQAITDRCLIFEYLAQFDRLERQPSIPDQPDAFASAGLLKQSR